jgi:hypothetical protein
MSLFGTALGLGLGVPGPGLVGGLLGAYSDVERAEEALMTEYGAHPPGYPTVGYDPDLSTWSAFFDAVTGIFGQSAAEQLADEISHLGVAGLEGSGYQTAAPSATEMTAAMEDAYGGGYGGVPTATEMTAAMEDAYDAAGVGGTAGPGGTGGGPGGGPGTGGGVGDDAGSPF